MSPGEEIAVSRNSHKSVITGLIHTGAVPVWLEPEYDGGLEVAHGIVPETLEQALDTHPGCRAVLITTPSYYGVCSDVPRLAEIAHARDLPLVSDDAWALAYKFHPELPPFALDVGADLAIGSVHKTASGFSQTSVISVKGSRIDTSRLSRVGAEFVTPYPPGIPLFIPGERITENIADYLKTGSADGIYVEGCVDQSLSSLRVVA